MDISQIYSKYKLLPNLQAHQKRVASVGKIIADHLTEETDTENVVKALLLHDMGNILKFNLDLFPDLLEPEGKIYWESVKEEYREKYGDDEHLATEQIAREICVNDRIMELIHSVGFSKTEENRNTTDVAKKICCYADQRVAIYGVTDLGTRLNEGRKRYVLNKGLVKDEIFEQGAANLLEIEKQIFSKSTILPTDVTDTLVSTIISSGYFETFIFHQKSPY